jgi:integrase
MQTATTKTGPRSVKLTAKTVTKLKPATVRQDVFDSEVRGLTLRIAASGAKTWCLNYRIGKRKRRWTIGPADQRRGGLSLAAARSKAKSALTALHDHCVDPADAKRAKRTASTFDDLFAAFLKDRAGKKSVAEYERVVRKHFLPDWKHRAAREITRRDVAEIIDDIAASAPIGANRALAYVSAVFTFGVRKFWFDTNPCWKIARRDEGDGRERVLTDDEVRELFAALDACTKLTRVDEDDDGPAITPMIARGLKAILLTAQRPGEVFEMRWQDVDYDEAVWTIPGSMTKNGKEHRVPLSDQMTELLDEAKADAPDENNFVFAGERGASVADRAKKSMARLRAAGAIRFHATRHDLRRTGSTLMEADGIADKVIDRVLNHRTPRDSSRVLKVYARHPFDAEKRVALETLARRIDAILAAKPASVIPFARAE